MNFSILVRRAPVFFAVFSFFAFGPTAGTFGETTDLDGLVKGLSAALQKAQAQTVVIGDFPENEGGASLQGAFLADRLWFAVLQQEKGFRTLNRGPLHRQLYARDLSNMSFEQAQVEAARAMGAQVLITGRIERDANDLKLAITAVDTSSTRDISQWTWVVPRTPSLDTLARQPIRARGPVYVLQQDGVSSPDCAYCPFPQYSEAARKNRIEGTVVVEAMIDASGRATKVWEVRGLPDGLTQQAVDAVRQWHFKAAQNADGRAVTVMVPVDVTFRLM
jgi:TonB family protein